MKKLLSESLHEFLNENEPFKGSIDTGLSIEDIDKKEFLLGLVIEKNKHSTDLGVQRELVIQNLAKNPKYYSEAMKKGLYREVNAINTYKKYFIDKENEDNEMTESVNENLRNELIDTLLLTAYRDENPIEIRKELEMKSEEELDRELSNYYLFDIQRKK